MEQMKIKRKMIPKIVGVVQQLAREKGDGWKWKIDGKGVGCCWLLIKVQLMVLYGMFTFLFYILKKSHSTPIL
jgi:hypothetical protein